MLVKNDFWDATNLINEAFPSNGGTPKKSSSRGWCRIEPSTSNKCGVKPVKIHMMLTLVQLWMAIEEVRLSNILSIENYHSRAWSSRLTNGLQRAAYSRLNRPCFLAGSPQKPLLFGWLGRSSREWTLRPASPSCGGKSHLLRRWRCVGRPSLEMMGWCIMTGWWFGTCLFFHILGIIIPQFD